MFNNIYKGLISGNESIAIIGLGYAGFPLAYEFSKYVPTIGFDIDENKINKYKEEIENNIKFTCDEKDIKQSRFIIVVVPTPVNNDYTPDLKPLEKACEIVGKNINKDTIVVFESTVYPGVTENVCIPIIEKESGLRCGIDFKVGYSPERINPGDKIHTLISSNKIISGIDDETINEIEKVYNIIVKGQLFKASNIKTAEAIKVIENSQRDVNIAFMNEISMICDCMGIDTKEVTDGMNTKWNALGFKPGLVGGHCLGVDPYYLISEAKKYGYDSKVIIAGRQINESMSDFVVKKTLELLKDNKGSLNDFDVAIYGMTYKENCPDVRNSKVVDIYRKIKDKGIDVYMCDYMADKKLVKKCYDVELVDIKKIPKVNCVIVAVAHDKYKNMPIHNMYKDTLNNNNKILIDIKGIYNKEDIETLGIKYFSL